MKLTSIFSMVISIANYKGYVCLNKNDGRI